MGASVSNVSAEAPDVFRLHRRIDVAEAVGLPAPCQIAVDVVAPRHLDPGLPAVALCCLPGGYLGRGYFDLDVEGDASYSFAGFMAARGFVTLTLDHLGSGESTMPEDGYAVTLDRVVDANRWAMEKVLGELREPGPAADGDRPDFGPLPSVGVGHSMGSALSVVQQARATSHAALVLFSFSARGLEKYLLPEEKKYANRPEETWANLPELARARFFDALSPGGGAEWRGLPGGVWYRNRRSPGGSGAQEVRHQPGGPAGASFDDSGGLCALRRRRARSGFRGHGGSRPYRPPGGQRRLSPGSRICRLHSGRLLALSQRGANAASPVGARSPLDPQRRRPRRSIKMLDKDAR